MSMKIYNGIKFTSNDFFVISKQVNEMFEKIADFSKDAALNVIINMAVNQMDVDCMNGVVEKINYISQAEDSFDDRVRKVRDTKQRDPAIDFDMELCIIPHDGAFYGIIFAEQNEVVSLIKNTNGIEEFAYWDNSDPDEDLSEEDWENRSKVWNSIFKDGKTPSQVGFVKEFKTNTFFFQSEIKDYFNSDKCKIPSFEKRVENFTSSLFFKSESKNIEKMNYAVIRDIQKKYDNLSLIEKNALNEKVVPILIKDISFDLLSNNLNKKPKP